MRRAGKNLIVLSSVLGMTGCISLAPRYERPPAPVPARWPTGPAFGNPQAALPTSTAAAMPAETPWQDFVLDARLRQVIAQALHDNRTLREQAAAVLAARAQYRVQRASLFPTIDAALSGSKERIYEPPGLFGPFSTSAFDETNYEASVGLTSYELDFFGRLRSLSTAALESYLATAASARAARISLIGEVASAWVTLASDRSLLTIARQTAMSAERSMKVTQERLDRGVASAVDVREAETVYQQARADTARYITAVAQDRDALELLVGGPVADTLLPDGIPDHDTWFADVQAGLSSKVLLERPDVLAAEHDLRAANANIGAARAAFFPSVTLTGDGGLASDALSTLIHHATSVWSIAPTITLPLFAGGANVANLEYTKAEKQQAVAAYELAVQTAFQEVADALARRGTMDEQLAADRALVTAAAASYRLAEARYEEGVDTYLNALDAQRTLYSAQSTLVQDRLTALDNRVTLYKVLGGGLAQKSGS